MSARPVICGRDLWKIPADRRQRNGGWGGSCQASMVDIIAENTAVCNSEGKSESFKEKTGTSKSTPAGLGQSGAEHLRGPGRAQEPGALAEGGTGGDHIVHQKDTQPGEVHALFQAVYPEYVGPAFRCLVEVGLGIVVPELFQGPTDGRSAPGDSHARTPPGRNPLPPVRLRGSRSPDPEGRRGCPGHTGR